VRIRTRLARRPPTIASVRAQREFRRSFDAFAAAPQADPARLPVSWDERYPILDEATATTPFDRHYVYHVAWAARVLAATRPERHVDVSSSLYFAVAVSAFLPVAFYDYRPPELELDALEVAPGDLLALPFADRSVASLSCMHVVEHVGLGRYGEPLDPDGDLKAAAELQRVVADGGRLLFVVPVGRPRVVFNAHRVYGYEHVVDAFAELALEEFALIPDVPADGGLIRDADPALVPRQEYGCGCFLFRRGG
jgi:SAM-dependent methyltransferase